MTKTEGPQSEALRELYEYARTHFSAEEALLEQTKYPGLYRHRSQHQAFIDKSEELKQSLQTAPNTTPVDMAEYLKNWLVRHIKMVDQQYSAHPNANGIH